MKVMRYVILFVTILLMNGCAHSEDRINAPIPLLKGSIVTDGNWSYNYCGEKCELNGSWVHIPESDMANLLLYIETINKSN